MMSKELKLYSRSKNNIWTDTWISKNMLAAHLDLTSDGASRNINTINKTVDWITAEIKSNSTILDLGCGPGLYAEALTEKDYTVTGLDISKRSIKYAEESARKKNLAICYVNQDYIKKRIRGVFDTALCIYCDFGALIPEEQSVLLKNIYNALSDDGVLIFDVFSDGLSSSKKAGKSWNYYADGSFWCRGAHFVLEETVSFPDSHAWGTRAIVIGKGIKEYSTWDTYYTKEQITGLLRNNGFEVEKIKEDLVEKSDFTSNAVLFVKARKLPLS